MPPQHCSSHSSIIYCAFDIHEILRTLKKTKKTVVQPSRLRYHCFVSFERLRPTAGYIYHLIHLAFDLYTPIPTSLTSHSTSQWQIRQFKLTSPWSTGHTAHPWTTPTLSMIILPWRQHPPSLSWTSTNHHPSIRDLRHQLPALEGLLRQHPGAGWLPGSAIRRMRIWTFKRMIVIKGLRAGVVAKITLWCVISTLQRPFLATRHS